MLEAHGVSAKTLSRGKGCDQCAGTGYKGRTAIHEILIINDQIRDLIYQQATIQKVKEAALATGFKSIHADAFKKIAAGVTSIEEFLRSIG